MELIEAILLIGLAGAAFTLARNWIQRSTTDADWTED